MKHFFDKDTLRELVKKARSYRRYDATYKIRRETLLDLVDLARITSSAANKQPFKYLVSCTPEENNEIFSTLGWAALLKDWKGPSESQEPAAYIVLIFDKTISSNPNLIDVGIIAQTISLGAAARGLGACMFGSFSKSDLGQKLALSEQLEPVLVIAVGKPDETILLEDAKDGNVVYYRDGEENHHVPKRPLNEIIINRITEV